MKFEPWTCRLSAEDWSNSCLLSTMHPNKTFRERRSPIVLTPRTMPPKLSVLDILHRTVVYSLVGISVYGIGMGVVVHRDTLRRGRGV